MGMDSYLELFTTMYGWAFANTIFTVLSSTGLVVLPFLFLFVAAWLEAHERGVDAQSVTWLVRKLEVQVWTALFVFITCVAPMNVTSLTHSSLYYTPTATAIDPAPTTVTGDASGTTYNGAFADTPGVAAVPPWWYTVMAISSGVNAGVRAGVGSGMRDFRVLQDLAHSATIEDPKLREEVQGFNSECFIPARSRYYHQMQGGTPAIDAAIAEFGAGDVDWMGSRAFRAEPTLYPSMYSRRYLPQFPFDPDIDTDIGPDEDPPTGSRRSCATWWETPAIGLRAKLADRVGTWQSFQTKLTSVVTFVDAEQELDVLARIGLRSARPGYFDHEKTIGDDRDISTKIGQTLTYNLGMIGLSKEALVASASLGPLIQFLQMAQPLVLMALYMFLPLATVLSGYSLQVFVSGAIAIFTVKFWQVMWFIARWVDDHLIEAMYPDANVLIERLFEGLQSDKRMVLNILLVMLYVGLPMIWTSVMAWAGYNIASGISSMLKSSEGSAQRAGSTGAGILQSAAMGGVNARISALKGRGEWFGGKK